MDQTLNTLLDLESGEPVPPVNESTLELAHQNLQRQLNIPFTAIYSEPENADSDAQFQVTVSRILSVGDHPVFGPYLGILCEAEVNDDEESIVVPLSRITEVQEDHNSKYINVYNEWFWNFR